MNKQLIILPFLFFKNKKGLFIHSFDLDESVNLKKGEINFKINRREYKTLAK
jgi:hypothetical protein